MSPSVATANSPCWRASRRTAALTFSNRYPRPYFYEYFFPYESISVSRALFTPLEWKKHEGRQKKTIATAGEPQPAANARQSRHTVQRRADPIRHQTPQSTGQPQVPNRFNGLRHRAEGRRASIGRPRVRIAHGANRFARSEINAAIADELQDLSNQRESATLKPDATPENKPWRPSLIAKNASLLVRLTRCLRGGHPRRARPRFAVPRSADGIMTNFLPVFGIRRSGVCASRAKGADKKPKQCASKISMND